MDDDKADQTPALAPVIDAEAVAAATSVEAILAATSISPTTNLVRSLEPDLVKAEGIREAMEQRAERAEEPRQ